MEKRRNGIPANVGDIGGRLLPAVMVSCSGAGCTNSCLKCYCCIFDDTSSIDPKWRILRNFHWASEGRKPNEISELLNPTKPKHIIFATPSLIP